MENKNSTTKQVKSFADQLIWIGLVLLSFGTLWVLKFTIQRAVQDGINNSK